MKVPLVFHFIFGLKVQTEPFHLMHYLCLASCAAHYPDAVLHMHYRHEPFGPLWEAIKPRLNLRPVVGDRLATLRSKYSSSREGLYILQHNLSYAHEADFIRLEMLASEGGVYADMDTLFVQRMPDWLFHHDFVMGEETPTLNAQELRQPSLCNALMLSRPGAAFASKWLADSYTTFDGTWSSHSCRLAASGWRNAPNTVCIVPARFFFRHGHTVQGLATLYEGLDTDFSEIYSLHLWAHMWWEESVTEHSHFHQGLITPERILAVDTTFNVLARRYLPRA